MMKWTQRAGKGILVDHWPEKGTVDYYATLADRDRIMRGPGLMDVDQRITFSDGNSTLRISSLGLYVFLCTFLPFLSVFLVFKVQGLSL